MFDRLLLLPLSEGVHSILKDESLPLLFWEVLANGRYIAFTVWQAGEDVTAEVGAEEVGVFRLPELERVG